MSDIKLFRTSSGTAQELQGTSIAIEKTLQVLIEHHLDIFLGVKFLATEYTTGKSHGGRIDTLGIDENGSPVIIEYKRALNENVINQGLFYLDWLMDHKGEFELLVLKKFGNAIADAIDWSTPRLLCIASDFTKYDEHAVQQINRNIELIRYRRYENDFILFELANVAVTQNSSVTSTNKKNNSYKSQDVLDQSSSNLQDRFDAIKVFLLALGDDVQMNTLKHYFAFRRIKNFVCVEIHPSSNRIILFVKVNPDTIKLEKGFTRDVRNLGHFGTGDLEITITNNEDFERAKDLILRSYERS